MSQEKNTYRIISEDTKIWQESKLVMYLNSCALNDQDIVLDFYLEGPCCTANGLYNILDDFCNTTGYNSDRITITTANLVEHHDQYNIHHIAEYWYEIKMIQDWVKTNQIETANSPTLHFGSFIGRSTWARCWIAALLNKKYASKTIQTFHSGFQKNYVIPVQHDCCDTIGLDELSQYNPGILSDVIDFLKKCPIVIDKDIDVIKQMTTFISPSNDGCYPIQHPANLIVLNYYNMFFVDIVTETRMIGNVFFVTEKTWRCILARRPFIIVGSQFFLQNLKRLGFKTFNDFWDEGYDEYPPTQRILEIEKLLKTISQWDLETCSTKLNEMNDILDHNYQTLISLTYNQIQEVFK